MKKMNVEDLKVQFEKMKLTNPNLEYSFFEQIEDLKVQLEKMKLTDPNDEEKGDSEDTISIVKEIREELKTLDRKLNLIFDDHILINGEFKKMDIV